SRRYTTGRTTRTPQRGSVPSTVCRSEPSAPSSPRALARHPGGASRGTKVKRRSDDLGARPKRPLRDGALGYVRGVFGCVPALACGLAADAQPVGNLGPGVPECPQSDYGALDSVLNVGGEGDHRGEGFDVTGGDPATVGPHDAAGEGSVLVVLSNVALTV